MEAFTPLISIITLVMTYIIIRKLRVIDETTKYTSISTEVAIANTRSHSGHLSAVQEDIEKILEWTEKKNRH